MDRLGKIFKKSPKPPKPPKHITLGIPTNIAAGPLGFRAELDIDPKGEQNRLSRSRTDSPDSTATLDKKSTGPSRIVVHDERRGDQAYRPPGISTAGAVVGGDEPGNDPAGERFWSLLLRLMLTWISIPFRSGRGHL